VSPFLLALTIQALAPSPASVAKAVDVAKLADLRQDVLIQGSSRALGVDGSYGFRLGPGGKFVFDIKSALGQKIGFDGKDVWEVDRSGATRVLAFSDADTQLVQGALLSNAWLLKGAAVITPGDNRTLNVKLKNSEIDQVITLDEKTDLPKSMTYQSSAGKVEVLLENWTNTPAGKLPMKVLWREGGVEQSVIGTTVQTAPPLASAYQVPVWLAKDTTFDPALPNEVETKRLSSGHMIVKAAINGKDAGWFIFDSGAEAMCVDKSVADELGLPKMGEVPAVGIGGVEKVPFRTGTRFSVGPATIQDVHFLQLDLAQIGKMLKLKLGGIVGYDVFRRMIVEMDVKKPSISLFDPAKYTRAIPKWTPIKFDGGNIGMEASFEGNRTGWFRLDTGAGGTVSFHGPFVEKFKLLDGRKTVSIMEGGVGGMQEAKRGQIAYFEMAGHRFDKPEATFSISKSGAFHDHWLIGNIGQNFIDPFILVFDYPQSRIAFLNR
jgi:hypothetical protein